MEITALSKAVRILLAAESLAPGNGGIGRVARLIARVLENESRAGRLQCSAVAFGDDIPPNDFNFPTVVCHKSQLRFTAQMILNARRATHIIYDSLSLARAQSVLLGRRKYAVFMHGIEVWENARSSHLNAARNADLLLANSDYTIQRASRLHAGLSDAKRCWLATEQDTAAPQTSASDGPPTVLILSRIDRALYKGHPELITAWPAVAAAVPGAELLIVGHGPGLERVRSLAQNSPVRNLIHVKGFVPEDQMESIWSRSNVFAMPSRGEGFGLVYIEAMRHGLPVVASIHDAAHEINIDGETGYNVSLDANELLADRIIDLLKSSEKARQIGKNGVRVWEGDFRFGQFESRFKPLVEQFTGLRDSSNVMGTTSRKTRNRRRIIVAFGILIVLTLMFGELFARYYLGLGDPPLSIADPQIEYLFAPSRTYHRFGNVISYNQYSMRGTPDFPKTKSNPNELRLLVIGDSVINGGALTDDHDIATNIIQRRLQSDLNRPVIVGNISAGSWGPPNELAYLQRFGLFDADEIVIELGSGDYADVPTFEPTVGVSPSFPDRSPMFALQEAVQRYLLPRLGMAKASANETGTAPVRPSEADIQTCLQAVKQMVDRANATNARVVIVLYPDRSETLGGQLPGYERFLAAAREWKAELVDLHPVFAAHRNEIDSIYRDMIHPTNKGQQMIAEALLPRLIPTTRP